MVANGGAYAVVTGTGMSTEIGIINAGVQEASVSAGAIKTPLAQKLDEFGNQLTKIIGGICLVVWVSSIPKFNSPAFGGSWMKGAVYHTKVVPWCIIPTTHSLIHFHTSFYILNPPLSFTSLYYLPPSTNHPLSPPPLPSSTIPFLLSPSPQGGCSTWGGGHPRGSTRRHHPMLIPRHQTNGTKKCYRTKTSFRRDIRMYLSDLHRQNRHAHHQPNDRQIVGYFFGI